MQRTTTHRGREAEKRYGVDLRRHPGWVDSAVRFRRSEPQSLRATVLFRKPAQAVAPGIRSANPMRERISLHGDVLPGQDEPANSECASVHQENYGFRQDGALDSPTMRIAHVVDARSRVASESRNLRWFVESPSAGSIRRRLDDSAPEPV
jgi:hypothetical protein